MESLQIVFLDIETVGALPELAQLHSLGDYKAYPQSSPEEVADRIRHAHIVLTNKVKITEAHLQACQYLRLICVTATGMNNVDLTAANARGISVKNVAGYAVETVAQHTFAVLLHLHHHLPYYDNYVKSGAYSGSPHFTHLDRPYCELAGKRMGIIGLGNIGRAVARVAGDGFGMKVVYHSTTGRNDNAAYQRLPLEELLATSDIVSIHAGLTAQTKSLIGRTQLAQMKDSALLINMGRGGIVVEDDLAKALDAGIIRGACMDVFEQEPLPADHPFLQLQHPERIVLSPHIAWAAIEARQRLMQGVIQHIEDYKNSL
ncbi:MAG: D-2-hydroxyacid dehydrogenase [Bacteroidota bacterium]